MGIVTEDEKLSCLTNPGQDDQLREILKGSDFDDYRILPKRSRPLGFKHTQRYDVC